MSLLKIARKTSLPSFTSFCNNQRPSKVLIPHFPPQDFPLPHLRTHLASYDIHIDGYKTPVESPREIKDISLTIEIDETEIHSYNCRFGAFPSLQNFYHYITMLTPWTPMSCKIGIKVGPSWYMWINDELTLGMFNSCVLKGKNITLKAQQVILGTYLPILGERESLSNRRTNEQSDRSERPQVLDEDASQTSSSDLSLVEVEMVNLVEDSAKTFRHRTCTAKQIEAMKFMAPDDISSQTSLDDSFVSDKRRGSILDNQSVEEVENVESSETECDTQWESEENNNI